jgi:hypothetical protein
MVDNKIGDIHFCLRYLLAIYEKNTIYLNRWINTTGG